MASIVFLAQDVAHADAQLLRVLEAVQNRIESSAPRHNSASVLRSNSARRQLVQHQAVHQLVDHARVADQNARQIFAGRAHLDVQTQRGRVEAEQLPQHPLAAERIADFSQVDERESGSGVAAIAFNSRGAIAARKCRQRRVDRKRIFSVDSAIRLLYACGMSRNG